MFFDEDYEPSIIDNKSIDELEMEQGILVRVINPTNLAERWAYFSYLKGLEAGLSDMYAVNFGSIISSFIGGMGVDAGTDLYFTLRMEDKIFDIYEDCRKTYNDEVDVVKNFFNNVLEFYKSPEGACTYEKAVFQHNITIPVTLRDWIEREGMTIKEFVLYLMDKKNTLLLGELDIPPWENGNNTQISFKLTFSQEEMWVVLESDDDPSRLRELMFS